MPIDGEANVSVSLWVTAASATVSAEAGSLRLVPMREYFLQIVCNSAADIDDCVSDPCGSNGTCVDQLLRYFCNCSTGYTGTHCETGNVSRYCN